MDLKNKIINYSREINIDLIGFTDADICYELEDKIRLKQRLGYQSELENYDLEKRLNPKLLMPGAETIIVIGLAYPKSCKRLEKLKKEEVYFSSSSWGTDYHIVLTEKLEKLAQYIKLLEPNLEYKIAVDKSPLDDRFLAYKAGLGFYGKNNLLINQEYGSYIFLGSLLINIDLPKDKPVTKSCLDCNLCKEACPTGAITDDGVLNSNLCLSYITQKKGELTLEEESLFTKSIYGCDICQRVCPHNKKIDSHHHVEFEPSDLEFINVKEYKKLSNKKFKDKYGKLSGAWRGKKIIERNIDICFKKIYKE
jgi:epoxyqueuosine reductase